VSTDESGQSPSIDRLTTLVTDRDREAAADCLAAFETADADRRKRAVQSLRAVADDDPSLFDGFVTALRPFLADEERAIRLSTAKLLVAVAAGHPGAARPVVEAVAERLADDDEFYYVRARCAETLGYVGLAYPEDVSSPEILADLRIGLAFDEPEVREKLAKALECVALGDPDRLRHQTADLAAHLDDDTVLVRYHLATALLAVGCAGPARLDDAVDPLAARLDDPDPYVRGRAAEALGVVASADGTDASLPTTKLDALCDGAVAGDDPDDDAAAFVGRRAAFALDAVAPDADGECGTLGRVDGVRATTDDAAEAIAAPDADGKCPHCGLELPAEGPPMCPRCGAPQ